MVKSAAKPAAARSHSQEDKMRPIAFVFAAAFAFALIPAHAGDYKAGPLDVSNPWSRATPKGSSAAAGYMKITNNGSTPDPLVSRWSEHSSKFEAHRRSMAKREAHKRPGKRGSYIQPAQTIVLQP